MGIPNGLPHDPSLIFMLREDKKLADLQRSGTGEVFEVLQILGESNEESVAKEIVAQAFHLAIDGAFMFMCEHTVESQKRHY